MEANSMWLQESLVVPDPLPSVELPAPTQPKPSTSSGMYPPPPPLPSTADDVIARGEIDVSKLRMPRASEQRPSLARLSTLGTPFGDDGRRQLSQLLREKEKWKTTDADLTQSRRQLADVKEELRNLQALFETEKSTTEMWRHRANEESKLRLEAEQNSQDAAASVDQKMQALQTELIAARREATKAQSTMASTLRSEMGERISTLERTADTLRQEVEYRSDAVSRLKDELEDAQGKLSSTTASLAEANLEIDNLAGRHADELQRVEVAFRQQLHALEEQRQSAGDHAAQLSQKMEEAQRRHADVLRQLTDTIEVLNERDGRVRTMLHEREDLRRELDDAQCAARKAVESQEQADTALKSVQSELDATRAKIARLESEMDSNTRNTGALRDQHAKLVDELAAAAEEVELTQQRLSDTAAEHEEAEGDLKEELQRLRERMQASEETWSAERAQLSRERMQLMSSESEARRSVVQLTKQLTEMEASQRRQLRSVEHDRDYWRAQCDTALSEAKSVSMDHQALMAEVTVLRSKVAQLERPATVPPSAAPRKQPREDREPLAARSANAADDAPPAKRAAPQGRVFAISGFDGKSLLEDVSRLPDAHVVDLKANATVPTTLTHLVATGDITIKLLSALVRGCWIVPARYVTESVAAGRWLPEDGYGFRHSSLPLHQKRIALTDKFASSRLCSTAELLLKEGGAVACDNRWEADFVLCHGSEASLHGDTSLTWERLVTLVYPRRLEAH